jgi:hypothetical protein
MPIISPTRGNAHNERVKLGVSDASKRNQNTGIRLSRMKADALSPDSEKGMKACLLAGFLCEAFAIIPR